ncbi:MAG: NAD(P)/FAD-dependent oxidoreductase, partial [Woeseiaceae bacterium]
MAARRRLSRRDFINGVALSLAAGTSLSPIELMAKMQEGGKGPYPPSLTGLRGSHPGSFEVAHAVSWAGAKFPTPEQLTDDRYDLVVVGGGISGLAAAFLYRQRSGPDAKILVLDNHDDFGGHARRNEFDVDGEKLICYGGSQSIDTPGHYSANAAQMLRDVGIVTERFYDYYDREYFSERNLGRGLWFSEKLYGRNVTAPDVMRGFGGDAPTNISKIIERYPIPADSRIAFFNLLDSKRDYLAGMSRDDKIAYLRSTSYTNFLQEKTGTPKEVSDIFRDSIRGLWGVGWDSLSALEAYRSGMPGTANLDIGDLENEPPGRDEPYIFHFPDGNAGVARALVRSLVPQALPGSTMEDLVLARADYALLDNQDSNVRIRLNSTAVDVRNTAGGKSTDVTYVRGGETFRV